MLAKLIADDLLSDENGAEIIAEIIKQLIYLSFQRIQNRKYLKHFGKLLKVYCLKKLVYNASS